MQPGGVRGTGSRVWPASVELARFLADNEELIRAKRVIEWGAGVGALPSLVAARAGAASVLASDGEPSAIPLLEHNVARNCEPGACEVRQLRWGCKEEALLMGADVILGEFSCIVKYMAVAGEPHWSDLSHVPGSDIVWGGGGGSRASQLSLFEALSKAAALNPSLLVLLSFCPRYKSEGLFWKEARSKFVVDGQWRPREGAPDSQWSEFTPSDFVQEGGGIWICRLRPCINDDCTSGAAGRQTAAAADEGKRRAEQGLEELLSDDSLLEAGGSALSLDDLINPLDARS